MVESSALLKRRSPKGYRGFESLPHRASSEVKEDKPNRSISAIPIGSGCEPLNLQTWWATRKHWHTDEFCALVDRHIQTAKPKIYEGYN